MFLRNNLNSKAGFFVLFPYLLWRLGFNSHPLPRTIGKTIHSSADSAHSFFISLEVCSKFQKNKAFFYLGQGNTGALIFDLGNRNHFFPINDFGQDGVCISSQLESNLSFLVMQTVITKYLPQRGRVKFLVKFRTFQQAAAPYEIPKRCYILHSRDVAVGYYPTEYSMSYK